MSAEGLRVPPLRAFRRKKGAALDLNMAPSENRDGEGTSSHIAALPRSIPPARIDVDAIDDDIIESSPGAFAEAKNNSRRNRRKILVDVDSGQTTYLADTILMKRPRVRQNQTSICGQLCINCGDKSMRERGINLPQETPPPASPPPKEPTFTCPICISPLVEETSTKCGHIFCKACIKTAIGKKAKCPTCRKRVTQRELIRVFLPVAK